MSFSNEPEDQDAFTFTEEEGSGANDTMSFRMFPLAVLDSKLEGVYMSVVGRPFTGIRIWQNSIVKH